MPQRNGLNPAAVGDAAEEFRKRAATLRDDAMQLGLAGKRLAEDALHQATDTAQTYYRQGRTRALAFEKTLEENIYTHPVRSLLMAAGIGFLLAKLLGRR